MSYNRGKWEHFIRPLFPFSPQGKCFVECGCNAGLFLLLAADAGFADIRGYEGDDGWYEQARFILNHYQRSDPAHYGHISLSHSRIGKSGRGATESCMMQSGCEQIDINSLAPADITLLANVLYWIDRETALQYIHELAASSAYCLVVSVEGSYAQGGPCSSKEVGSAFAEKWQEVERIIAPEIQRQEKRRDMFSILFRSKKFAAHHGDDSQSTRSLC